MKKPQIEMIDLGNGIIVHQCLDCGAHADSPTEIKHHTSCEPGSAAKWEKYYSRQE